MLAQDSLAMLPQDDVPSNSTFMPTNQSSLMTLSDPYVCSLPQETLMVAQPSQSATGPAWSDPSNLPNQYFSQ